MARTGAYSKECTHPLVEGAEYSTRHAGRVIRADCAVDALYRIHTGQHRLTTREMAKVLAPLYPYLMGLGSKVGSKTGILERLAYFLPMDQALLTVAERLETAAEEFSAAHGGKRLPVKTAERLVTACRAQRYSTVEPQHPVVRVFQGIRSIQAEEGLTDAQLVAVLRDIADLLEQGG